MGLKLTLATARVVITAKRKAAVEMFMRMT